MFLNRPREQNGPIIFIISKINILPDAVVVVACVVVVGSTSVVDVVVGALVVVVGDKVVVRVVVGCNPVVIVDGPDDACVVVVVGAK